MTYKALHVKRDTHDLVMKECTKEFRRHHKEFDGKPVPANHIVRQIANFYLKQ